MLELFLDDFNDIFEVSPSVIEHSGQFSISVKNNKRLDFEKVKAFEFRVRTDKEITKLSSDKFYF